MSHMRNTPQEPPFLKGISGNMNTMTTVGRPSKGDRDTFMTRPAREVGQIVRQKAAEEGIPMGDYISRAVAVYVGRPDLAPPPNTDEVLPLTG